MSTATWSPVPRNSRLRLPVTTRTTRHCRRRRTAQYQGMSQTATAAVLGLSVSGTKTRMQRPAAIQSRY
jgi:hypothetical protein